MYSRPQSQTEPATSSTSPQVIDLRSDTVTRPTLEMRRAMAEAEVGDDVYGEDPSINKLERRAAEIFLREAAIFVPTGTMGNQIAIKVHTHHGQEIICEERGHIFNYEMAMLASYSGCMVRPIYANHGILHWDQVKEKIAGRSPHLAQTGLVLLENTHNLAGGVVYPTAIVEDICDRAHESGLPVHLDGARIFNAATVLGSPVAEITRKFDSVMFCLSKGLGAPVGSMLVGDRKFIEDARRQRRALGGGMRQAGVLAAAALIALEKMPGRLHEDHANAHWLAVELSKTPGVSIDPARVQTNILVADVSGTGMTAAEIVIRLNAKGVLVGAVGRELVRLVTHFDVNRTACEKAAAAFSDLLRD